MLPATRVVLEDPLLNGVAFDRKTNVVAIRQFPVYLPLTVAALEPEGASDARGVGGVGEAVEIHGLIGRYGCRIDTVVGHDWTIDDNLEDLRSLSCRQHVASGTATIVLFQSVFQIERLSSLTGEVDNDVDAFGYRKARAGHLYRLLQQVAVRRDLPERLGRVVWSEDKHLVEARRSGVQPAEGIPAWAYVQHRLNLAVDEVFVTEDSVCIEKVERE